MMRHQHPDLGPVDVYPVGALASLIDIRRALVKNHRHPAGPPWKVRLRVVKVSANRIVRTVARHIDNRDWRTLRQNFNGYLAEPYAFPSHMTRCGHGWTKRRALADLTRHHRATSEETK